MKTIQKSTLDFLSQLKNNNNREWFLKNKSAYTTAKYDFEVFTQEVINQIVEFDPILKGLEVKSCVFRINRDIRFSHDKSPYKTNFGAFIVRGGKQNGDKNTGYYIHIEPGKSFIAGGAYMPQTAWLSAIREKIVEEPEKFIQILNNREFIKHFGALTGDKLKKVPKGYPSDHPQAELLKFKSYLVVNEVKDNKVLSADFFQHVIFSAKAMKPLNDFLNEY